jgi:hypothetical protein
MLTPQSKCTKSRKAVHKTQLVRIQVTTIHAMMEEKVKPMQRARDMTRLVNRCQKDTNGERFRWDGVWPN